MMIYADIILHWNNLFLNFIPLRAQNYVWLQCHNKYRNSRLNMEYKTASSSSDIQWCFSQVKGTLDDDVTEGKTIIIVIKKS